MKSSINICSFSFTPQKVDLKLQNSNYENDKLNENEAYSRISKILYYVLYILCFVALFFPGFTSSLIFMTV